MRFTIFPMLSFAVNAVCAFRNNISRNVIKSSGRFANGAYSFVSLRHLLRSSIIGIDSNHCKQISTYTLPYCTGTLNSRAKRRSRFSVSCTSLRSEEIIVEDAPNQQFNIDASSLRRLKEQVGKPEAVDILQDIIRNECGGVISPELFKELFSFELDNFQLEALQALASNSNVVLGSPTGSGKTVAGELAIYYALALGLRVFYTTPLKALSNQKFNDFRKRFGSERVGLMTGDGSYNRGAQITVMTTEVFRNMLYKTQVVAEIGTEEYILTGPDDLADVFAVVLDEFHYLNDVNRGTVWEESVISCPKHMLIIALSATMSNIVDLSNWIAATHGMTRLVTSSFRPVPLRYWFASKRGIYHLFKDIDSGPGSKNGLEGDVRNRKGGKKEVKSSNLGINPELESIYQAQQAAHIAAQNRKQGVYSKLNLKTKDGKVKLYGGRGGKRDGVSPRQEVPSYGYLVRKMKQKNMLPAIVFVFSRDRCDSAAKEVYNDGKSLLSEEEMNFVREKLEAYELANPQAPIGEDRWDMLLSGIASHHAGLLPAFKALVEDLFIANACKVVFATETLAAGINMPARSTVISSLKKWSDTGLATILPSQLLQMAGRAGRRGMDDMGNVVLMQSIDGSVRDAHRLLLSPLDAVESRFKSSYSMAVNILKSRDVASAKKLVEKSFGNYLQMKKLTPAQEAATQAESRLDSIRSTYAGIDFNDAVSYRKLWDAHKKEERNFEFLKKKESEDNLEMIETILPLARLGAGLLLTNGATVALLGDYTGPNNANKWCMVLHQDGSVSAIAPHHVSYIDVEDGRGLERKLANEINAMISITTSRGSRWYPKPFEDLDSPAWAQTGSKSDLSDMLYPPFEESELWDHQLLKNYSQKIPGIAEISLPGHVLRQKAAVMRAREQLQDHPIHDLDWSIREGLLYDSKDIKALEKQIKNGWRTELNFSQPAWDNFVAITNILIKYGALLPKDITQVYSDIGSNEDLLLRPTAFGDLIGGINTDNELWLALVLTHPSVRKLTYVQLAGLIPTVVSDYSRPDMMSMYDASLEVKSCLDELAPLAFELDQLQTEANVQLPIYLNSNLGGLVESWAQGCDWSELCGSTSVDEGDICRLLRRTIDVLKQITLLKVVDNGIKDNARRAFNMMDRFPVSDDVVAMENNAIDESEDDEPVNTQYISSQDDNILES